MVTTEYFENLKNLQSILVKKYDLEEKVESAPKQLGNQELLLSKAQKEFKDQQEAFDTLQSEIETLKSDLEAAVQAREAGEKGVAESTTHREFETLEKAIAEASEKEETARKELQQKEKESAELQENLKETEGLIEATQASLDESKASLNDEVDAYKAELAELQAEEDKITPNIGQEDLFKFQRIIQRNSEGIVAVRNGVCTGCHMILPANFANQVREGENIKYCPYCSRILYYEEVSEDQQEDFFNIGAAGSLAGFDDDELDLELDDDEDLLSDDLDDLDKDSETDADDSDDTSDDD